MPLNGLINDIINSVETNILGAKLHAAMLPEHLECVQNFRKELSEFADKKIPELREKIFET